MREFPRLNNALQTIIEIVKSSFLVDIFGILLKCCSDSHLNVSYLSQTRFFKLGSKVRN